MNYSVSVIIPSYHRTIDILSRAVESVQRQEYPILEIIIVDDNENGSILSKSIKAFCFTHQLKYIQSGGIGGAGARNCGANAALGEYIAFLDDDDEWLPEKLKVQLALFTSADIGLVYSRGYTVTVKADGTIFREHYATDQYYKTEVRYGDLLAKNYIGTTTQIVVRRDILQTIGGFDETLPSRQDYDLCLRVAKNYRCVGADHYLFIHYLHNDGQITSNPHTNMVGYRMLLHKYQKDIRRVDGAYRGFCYRIARCARADRSYVVLIMYTFLALLDDPFCASETIKKCLNIGL